VHEFPYPKEDHLMKKFLVLYMASAAEFEKIMKNPTPSEVDPIGGTT